MATASKPKKHAEQVDTLITAQAIPCDVLPRGQHATRADRIADYKQCAKELATVAAEMRDAQNAMVREWLGYHYLAGTSARLAAREPGTEGLPAELFLAMYHAAKPCAPAAASDVLTCALNWLVSTIRTQQSPRSNLRRWQAVLLPRTSERAWHWGEPQPIRLSAKTAQVERVGGELQVVVRVLKGCPPIRLSLKKQVGTDRELRPNGPGRNGQKFNARLDLLRSRLATNGALLTERSGRWQFTFLERKAAPRLPVKETLKTMFVRTSTKAGWRVRLAGRSAFLVGGEALADLANARREQMVRRSELKAAGVDSRTKGGQLMKHRWENYTRTLCQQTVAEIVTWAAKHGVERIAVMAGDEWCALGSVGNDDLQKSEPTRFPFAAFATFLRQKSQHVGIIVTSRANLRSVKRRKELWRRKLALDELAAVAK